MSIPATTLIEELFKVVFLPDKYKDLIRDQFEQDATALIGELDRVFAEKCATGDREDVLDDLEALGPVAGLIELTGHYAMAKRIDTGTYDCAPVDVIRSYLEALPEPADGAAKRPKADAE